MAGTGSPARKRLGWALLSGVSVLAGLLLVVHVIWPDRVDAISLILLGIMAAPALGLVLNSAELPGGIKIQFRDLQQRVARTEETADAAMGAATEQAALARQRRRQRDLITRSDDASRVPATGPAPEVPPGPPFDRSVTAPPAAPGRQPDVAEEPAGPRDVLAPPVSGAPALTDFGLSGEASAADESVAALADEYLRLRREMPSGPARTRRFTGLAGRMMVRTVADPGFYPLSALASDNGGQRLAGYAYALAQRDSNLIEPVYRATVADEYPFNQSWGLRALLSLLSETDTLSLTNEQAAALRAMRDHVGDDASRTDQIDDILSLVAARGQRPVA
jgi:hypothetical protein